MNYDGKVLAFCYVYSQEAECTRHINSRLAFGNPLNQGNQDIHFIEHMISILGSFEIDNNSSQVFYKSKKLHFIHHRISVCPLTE